MGLLCSSQCWEWEKRDDIWLPTECSTHQHFSDDKNSTPEGASYFSGNVPNVFLYFTILRASQTIERRTVGRCVIDELEGICKETVADQMKYGRGICHIRMRKQTRTSLRTVEAPVEIRIWQLLNTIQEL